MIIIGYLNGDCVHFATDTRQVVSDIQHNDLCESNYKIRKLDNGIVYAFSGEFANAQLLKANEELFTLDKSDNLTMKHVVTNIIPKIQDVMTKNNTLISDNPEEPLQFGGTILLAYKNMLFKIYNDFSVVRSRLVFSIGSLYEYAIPATLNLKPDENLDRNLVNLLKVCSQFSTYIGGPYLTINTKDLEYKLWEE